MREDHGNFAFIVFPTLPETIHWVWYNFFRAKNYIDTAENVSLRFAIALKTKPKCLCLGPLTQIKIVFQCLENIYKLKRYVKKSIKFILSALTHLKNANNFIWLYCNHFSIVELAVLIWDFIFRSLVINLHGQMFVFSFLWILKLLCFILI